MSFGSPLTKMTLDGLKDYELLSMKLVSGVYYAEIFIV
jgi:hypothetical protein